MILDISALLSGEKHRLDFEYPLHVQIDAEDHSVNLSNVEFPEAGNVRGYVTDNAGYMRLSLAVVLPYRTICARCAKPVHGNFVMNFERTVVPEGTIEDPEEKEDDYAVAVNGKLDVDAQLIEILGIEFPPRILCKDNCRGLCQRCGKDLNEGDCHCPKTEMNPVFADLLEQLEAEQSNKEEK